MYSIKCLLSAHYVLGQAPGTSFSQQPCEEVLIVPLTQKKKQTSILCFFVVHVRELLNSLLQLKEIFMCTSNFDVRLSIEGSGREKPAKSSSSPEETGGESGWRAEDKAV